MLLRMLLVLVAVVGLSVSGCEKKEPTTPPAEVPAVVEEATEAAEEAAPVVEEAAAEAEEAAEHPEHPTE